MNFSCTVSGGARGWILAVGLLSALAWHARRTNAGGRLLFLRAAATFALVVLLLEPAFSLKRLVQVKPKLLILVDAGPSMHGSRLAQALSWLKSSRGAIEAKADPILVAASQGAARVAGFKDLAAVKTSPSPFDPARVLREVLDDWGISPQRVWVLSDGNAQPSEEMAGLLTRLKLPVDVLGVGSAKGEPSLGFTSLKTPDFAFLHETFSVQTEAAAAFLAGSELTLKLISESAQADGKVVLVGQKNWRVASDYENFSASFTVAAQSLGSERYRLELSGRGLAVSRQFHVDAIRQKYRIMYLAGRPSPEYAHLREFLKSDPNRELVSFVILRNPENPVKIPDSELSLIPFPAHEIFVQNIREFDLFILENFSFRRFNLPPAYLEAIKAFVASGGALLVIGGESAFAEGGYLGSPLEELFPVTLSAQPADFVPGLFKPKPVVLKNPLVNLYDSPEATLKAWESLPELDGFARFGSVRPQSSVLVVHPTERTAANQPLPILAVREYGRGKVMLSASDSTWRWHLGANLDWRTSSFYGRFWSKAVEYLTGSLDLSKVKFSPLPDRVPPREPAVFGLRVFDENFQAPALGLAEVSVLWRSPAGSMRKVFPREKEPGAFVLELTGLIAGRHHLKAVGRLKGRPWGEDEVSFRWEPAGPKPPMDRQWLKALAQLSSGGYSDLSIAQARDFLDRLSPTQEDRSDSSAGFDPAASGSWLACACALFLLEWALRRWKGHA